MMINSRMICLECIIDILENGSHSHKVLNDTLNVYQYLEKKEGYNITYLNVGTDGLINLEELKNAITDKTILVSVMGVNNEIGVVQDLKSIGKICREKGELLFTDYGISGI